MSNFKSSLSHRALLVSLNISQWGARKSDKKANATVVSQHKSESSAGNYTKKLLPGAAELEKIHAISSLARKYFHTQTLPWMTDGTRIISAKNYMNFVAEMRKQKSEFEKLVSEFSVAYPQLRTDAAKKLGDLYNLDEYPSSIEDKFSFEDNYFPLPDSSDFRIVMSDSQKKDFEKKIKAVESKAMGEVWERLHSVIRAAIEKFSSPDLIFRDSLLTNISELVAMLPMLNISEDSDLDRLATETNDLVSKLSAETIRENQTERKDAAKALTEIENKMKSFMGVK